MNIHRIKNLILLHLGFTLKNRHKNYVTMIRGVQYQNKRWGMPYKMDDHRWKIHWGDIPKSQIKRMKDTDWNSLIPK